VVEGQVYGLKFPLRADVGGVSEMDAAFQVALPSRRASAHADQTHKMRHETREIVGCNSMHKFVRRRVEIVKSRSLERLPTPESVAGESPPYVRIRLGSPVECRNVHTHFSANKPQCSRELRRRGRFWRLETLCWKFHGHYRDAPRNTRNDGPKLSAALCRRSTLRLVFLGRVKENNRRIG
jgi:hypothetical protein